MSTELHGKHFDKLNERYFDNLNEQEKSLPEPVEGCSKLSTELHGKHFDKLNDRNVDTLNDRYFNGLNEQKLLKLNKL